MDDVLKALTETAWASADLTTVDQLVAIRNRLNRLESLARLVARSMDTQDDDELGLDVVNALADILPGAPGEPDAA